MKSKTPKALEEVWEMKEKLYEEYKSSGFTSYVDFINFRTKDIVEEIYNTTNQSTDLHSNRVLPT